jgi:hypothetical protein
MSITTIMLQQHWEQTRGEQQFAIRLSGRDKQGLVNLSVVER